MDEMRPSTPPPKRHVWLEIVCDQQPPVPTPASCDGDCAVVNARGVVMPPSPGDKPELVAEPEQPSQTQSPPLHRNRVSSNKKQRKSAQNMRTQRLQHKDAAPKLAKAVLNTKSTAKKPINFLDLPGEIRNLVYKFTLGQSRQALLVHLPRMASLRSRTRVDRYRTLPSDAADKALESQLSEKKKRGRESNDKHTVARETNRPFFGLTQVCKQLRYEYRPIYMLKQEIGLDITKLIEYLQAFYPNAPAEKARLYSKVRGKRGPDMPFNGNLTIAVNDLPSKKQEAEAGIEVAPLLELWANSHKIEAGFGRYIQCNYIPERDGEAKDLYRLFGRRVLPNRSCAPMNSKWRTILRTRVLASVKIHRKTEMSWSYFIRSPGVPPPHIHILFRKEKALPWMTNSDSLIPHGWLEDHGFGLMEHFTIKVGVAS